MNISERIYEFVKIHPGVLKGYLFGALGIASSRIPERLAGMERTQLLLSEDDKGRLYPFSQLGVIES